MEFRVIDRFGRTPGRSKAYLTWDDWNDFSYRTLYGLVYVDENAEKHELGGVKIAYVGQQKIVHPLPMNTVFTQLEENFFSLGTSDEYYQNLNRLGAEIRDEILIALKDIAKIPASYEIAVGEEVTNISFFRSVSPTTVTGQFRRICNGGARLTEYRFMFRSPTSGRGRSFEFSFEVLPASSPPTNIHVLIGRNGVGKTYLLNQMIDSLVSVEPNARRSGEFVAAGLLENEQLFANLVSVTFSAFDETEPQPEQKDKTKGILYYYIGLKRIQTGTEKNAGPKSTTILRNEFLKSLNACKISPKYDRWKEAITTLESDPNFRDSEVKNLIGLTADSDEYKTTGSDIFKSLSSGHKIVLLTITRLVETLQEKTLVIIDEPEAHLHPPLLSAFIRAVSDLLTITNGVAIIATHSPVILQEVPKSCVWKLRKAGDERVAERLETESFGENVGTLTSEVFGLEVTSSGFYKLLSDQVDENKSYQEIVTHFGNQLGKEARAVLMALIANRNNN